MIDLNRIEIDPRGTASTYPVPVIGGRTRSQAALGVHFGREPDPRFGAPRVVWQGDSTRIDPLDWQAADVHAAPTSPLASQLEFIRGALPNGYRLVLALPVELRQEGLEIVASQQDLRLHSFGSDIPTALENFKAILVEQLERLERYAGRLTPAAEEDLELLRALVRR